MNYTDLGFDPCDTTINQNSIELSVSVLCGRHLDPEIRKGSDYNTFVKLEIIGCPVDCCYGKSGTLIKIWNYLIWSFLLGTTNVIRNNAFNPCWDETFNFNLIYRPSLALLRISVYHQNPKTAKNPGSQKKLGQATIPIEYLRPGIR